MALMPSDSWIADPAMTDASETIGEKMMGATIMFLHASMIANG